jgi:predicted PurR-regulated permease PerM
MNLLIGIVVLLVSALLFGVVFSRWSDWYDRSPRRAGTACVLCVTAGVAVFVLLILSVSPWG